MDSTPLGPEGLIHPSADGTPLFNGDPLLHRLDFDGGDVTLTSGIPHTPCYFTEHALLSEEDRKRFPYSNHGLARLSFGLGFRNEVNTAVVPLRFNAAEGNRLLITWDAGRPFEIDPVSLEIATAVGFNHEWREQIPLQLPFGIYTSPAHPAFDPDAGPEGGSAQLFTLNYGKSLGTALHPILHGEVDAPFDAEDEEVQAEIERLITLAEWLLRVARWVLRLLEILDPRLPDWLNGWLSGALRGVLGAGQSVLGPVDAATPVTRGQVASGVVGLVATQVQKQPLQKRVKPTTSSVDEAQRLLRVARKLLKDADKMRDFVHLIRWDGQQEKLQQWAIRVETGNRSADGSPRILQSMHQMGVTQDYVILMDTVFKLGAEQLLTAPVPDDPEVDRAIRNLLDFRQSDVTVLYIVSRRDLTPDRKEVIARRVTLPYGTAHFLVDHDNPGQRITLHCAHNNGWDAAEWCRPYDTFPDTRFPGVVGMATCSTRPNPLARYVIDGESGELIESKVAEDPGLDLTWMLALCAWSQPDGVTPPPRIHQIFWNGWGCHGDLLPAWIESLYAGAATHTLSEQEAEAVIRRGLPATLVRLDTDSMTIADRYVFPAGRFGNSVQFLPSAQSTPGGGEGYLLCVVNGSDDPTRSEFWLFDAARLFKGPLCRLGHPRVKVGLTIHSTWVPEIAPRRATYRVPVKEDYDQRLAHIKRPDLQELFDTYVYPHFP